MTVNLLRWLLAFCKMFSRQLDLRRTVGGRVSNANCLPDTTYRLQRAALRLFLAVWHANCIFGCADGGRKHRRSWVATAGRQWCLLLRPREWSARQARASFHV